MSPQPLRISGPELVVILQETSTNRLVVLLGDQHMDDDGMCAKQCKQSCIHVVEFIQNIALPKDIFLESPWLDKHEKRVYKPNLHLKYPLDYAMHKFHSAMYSAHKTHSNSRIHYTDIRYTPSITPLVEVCDAFHQGWDAREVEENLQEFGTLQQIGEFMQAILFDGTATWGEMFAHTRGSKQSTVLHKQFSKLPAFQQTLLKKYHNEVWRDLKRNHNSYNRVTRKFMSTGLQHNYAVPATIAHVFIEVTEHLLNMYMIARILRFQGSNEVSVVYAGSNHALACNAFFTKFARHKTKYFYSNLDGGPHHRCIPIPHSWEKRLGVQRNK